MAALTQEQLEQMLELGDTTSMEQKRARLLASAKAMYGMPANIKKNDLGSNLGRAAYGISGSMNDYKAAEMEPKISDSYRGNLQKLIAGIKNQRGVDPAAQATLAPNMNKRKQPLPDVPLLAVPGQIPLEEEEY